MRERFLREVATAGLSTGPPEQQLITEAELAPLPEAARRFFDFMRVVGKSRDWSFRVATSGSFRLGPGRAFLPCRAWQYDTRLGIARVFHIAMRFYNMPVLARDSYVAGRGRMQAKVLNLLPVEDAWGPELDTSELVTYLNDAICFAPSMLLGTETRWSAPEPDAFEVALTDRGRTVSARVSIDEQGRPREFSTTDRFVRDPYEAGHPLIRGRWITTIRAWTSVDGRPVLGSGQAIWQLAKGTFVYADMSLVPGSLAFNVPPGT